MTVQNEEMGLFQCLFCGKEVKHGEEKKSFLATDKTNLVQIAQIWFKINIKENNSLFNFKLNTLNYSKEVCISN